MEKIPDNNRKYLSDLKEETGMSWADLSAATKLPDSTIRKIFSGETADPRLETISLIVSAMGGSIDTMLSGKSAKEKTPHWGIPHKETSDGFDEVRSAYEKRLAEMQESYERYIESLKKDKSVLFAIACVLTAFLVLFLINGPYARLRRLDTLLIFGSRMREHGEFSRHGNIGTRTQKGRDGTQVRGRRNTETEGTRHKKAGTGTGAKLRRCSSRGNTARRQIRERRGGFDSII